MLGQLRAQVATAPDEDLGALARRLVDWMLAAAVGSAGHRERVLPAGHVRLQLLGGLFELRRQPLAHRFIEPPAYGVCSAMRLRRCATRSRTARWLGWSPMLQP